MKKLSVGVIGVGIHGTRYGRHITRDVPGLELTGVFRRDEAGRRAAAEELDTRAFESADALIEASDAVVVVTPPPSHASLVELALRHGKYVLVEKPVTANAAEADRLLRLDRDAGGRVMVAHTLRYDGVISQVKAQLARVGPIHHVRMAQRLSPSSLQWQRSMEGSGGGSILLTGVHLFDTVCWLLDEPIEIAHCAMERVLNPATEDFFIAVGRSRSGVHVAMEVSKYTTHRACYVEVVGEHGQLLGDYHQPSLRLGAHNDRTEISISPVHTVASCLTDFDAWMRGRIENPIPLSDGARAVALADRCRELGGG